MDKFGIFKLLNSFFTFYSDKIKENPSLASGGENNLASSLSSLFSLNGKNAERENNATNNASKPNSFNSQKAPNNANNSSNATNPSIKEKTPFAPLQQGMLLTMRSHDEIVKRVNSTNSCQSNSK